jgi:hypothetical protein
MPARLARPIPEIIHRIALFPPLVSTLYPTISLSPQIETHLLPINTITAMPRQNRQLPLLHLLPVPFRGLVFVTSSTLGCGGGGASGRRRVGVSVLLAAGWKRGTGVFFGEG